MDPTQPLEASDSLLADQGAMQIAQAAVEPDPVLQAAQPKRPDITPAQLVGLVPIVAALARAFGVWDASPEQEKALSDAVTAGLALFGADAIIRLGRNLARR